MIESSTNMIALSAGGDPEELATHEVGLEQVNELMVHLSRQLLQTGYRLAYGGTLGVPHEKLTELLIDAAVGLRDDTDREGVNSTSTIPERSSWPLVNYGAWPYHTWLAISHLG
ncbi:hypothetical protein C2W62_13345 [Candidatus Entotheonella serta]|nr:hypothetical protein C2W62_13345 [Candidatus Entotheonella serta]